MTIAAAIAIALHEILAALIPGSAPESPSREVVAHVEMVRVASRRIVAPRPVVHLKALRVVRERHVPPHHRRAGGHSALATRAPARRVAVIAYHGRPVWDTGGGHGVTADAAIGTSGGQGTGAAGSGAAGNGADAVAGDEPCGFVEFSDPHGSRYDRSTGGFYVDIRMSVHFADGSQQSMILDYPWYYATENANPWSNQNVKDPNFPTRFQPPPAAKIADEPQLVQYVAQHSTSDGMTLLRDCQGATEQRP